MRVSATHPSNEPLAYPILNPTGVSGRYGNIDLGPRQGSGVHAPLCPQTDRGAHGGVPGDRLHRDDGHDQPAARVGGARGSARKKVSQREFFACRVTDRARQRGSTITDPDLQPISMYHRGGRLFQQYVDDGAVQIEESKLAYQRNSQSELRVALYSGLADALQMDDNAGDFRWSVVLASSFVGRPRYIVQQYQDAMTIVQSYGKPDLFVTFTCNPGMSLLLRLISFGHSVVSRTVRREPPLLYITTQVVSFRLTLSRADLCPTPVQLGQKLHTHSSRARPPPRGRTLCLGFSTPSSER